MHEILGNFFLEEQIFIDVHYRVLERNEAPEKISEPVFTLKT